MITASIQPMKRQVLSQQLMMTHTTIALQRKGVDSPEGHRGEGAGEGLAIEAIIQAPWQNAQDSSCHFVVWKKLGIIKGLRGQGHVLLSTFATVAMTPVLEARACWEQGCSQSTLKAACFRVVLLRPSYPGWLSGLGESGTMAAGPLGVWKPYSLDSSTLHVQLQT